MPARISPPAALLTVLFCASLLSLVLVLSPLTLAYAEEVQYFTQFATISYRTEKDLEQFTRKLGNGLPFFDGNLRKDPRLTAKRLDGLVMRVMAILDMRMPGLRFSITIHPDDKEIQTAYAMYAKGKRTPVAYYDHAKRTIAVSADTVNENILAHEIAHAVICAWSPSPPPVATQEILANYVEEHVRKE